MDEWLKRCRAENNDINPRWRKFRCVISHAARSSAHSRRRLLRQLPASARAQNDYPNRPVRLIVGFAAGGGNDIFARLVGAKRSEILGEPVVVENRAGAGGRLSGEYVSNQPVDGYTLLVGAVGAM